MSNRFLTQTCENSSLFFQIMIGFKKPIIVKEIDSFKFSFYYKEGDVKGTYLTIKSQSGIFDVKIGGNTHVYGYLLAAAQKDLDPQLIGYAVMLTMIAMTAHRSQAFVYDLMDAIYKQIDRYEEQSKEKAESITEEEDKEAADIMRGAAEYSGKSKKEVKRLRKRDKRKLRDLIDETKESLN